ncbi:MAG: tRNA (adenosine(37)-N6)-threonylcarbamoyltransferase complex ATPase subunit type 1 TsaE [Nitrospirota bacterium]|nr:tRNA (adenosine(37)-N6)-threonylcarbamoyltransferase complex ATPase subunit type 1 TsaE [Nitrospirota bacterium]
MTTPILRTTRSATETARLGAAIGAACRGGEVLLLSGPLGAGKTHLTKGIAEGLQLDPAQVTSPTFTLLAVHHGRLPLYHVDLYRVEHPAELFQLELFDEVDGPGVTVIEWPEHGRDMLPPSALVVRITPGPGEERRLTLHLDGPHPPAHLLAALGV